MRERHPQVLFSRFGIEAFFGRDGNQWIGVICCVPRQAKVGSGGNNIGQMNEAGTAGFNNDTLMRAGVTA